MVASIVALVVGAVVAAVGLVLTGLAALRRVKGVRAVGGLTGDEGRGLLARDGGDLVFVRGATRLLLPWAPARGQAQRRLEVGRGATTTFVFRGSDHRVYGVGLLSPDAVTRVEARPVTRLDALQVVPKWLVVPAVLAAFVLPPSLAWWAAPVSVARVLDVTEPVDGPAECLVRVQRTPDVASTEWISCLVTPDVGDDVTVREVADYTGFALVADEPWWAATQLLVASAAVVVVLRALGRAFRATRSRPVRLEPVLGSAPGFDGSMPNRERHDAAVMPLPLLARAVAQAEGHGDVEDNDLIRTQVRAAWRIYRKPAAFGVAAFVVASLIVTLVCWQLLAGAVTLLVLTALGIGLLARGVRGRTSARAPAGARWWPWPEAVAWRRPDGRVAALLCDGGEVRMVVPVDRVFSPTAAVEVAGEVRAGHLVTLRAGGVDLFVTGPAERLTPRDAERLRHDLTWALLGPDPHRATPV